MKCYHGSGRQSIIHPHELRLLIANAQMAVAILAFQIEPTEVRMTAKDLMGTLGVERDTVDGVYVETVREGVTQL